jgi:geranylgeranyl transferase type-1 subunit beta
LRRSSNDLNIPLISAGSDKFEALITWLASRQTAQIEDPEEDDMEDDQPQSQGSEMAPLADRVHELLNIEPVDVDTVTCAGFNGRCNKYADTCYSFWNGATLVVCGNPRDSRRLLTPIPDAPTVFRGR